MGLNMAIAHCWRQLKGRRRQENNKDISMQSVCKCLCVCVCVSAIHMCMCIICACCSVHGYVCTCMFMYSPLYII